MKATKDNHRRNPETQSRHLRNKAQRMLLHVSELERLWDWTTQHATSTAIPPLIASAICAQVLSAQAIFSAASQLHTPAPQTGAIPPDTTGYCTRLYSIWKPRTDRLDIPNGTA